MPADPPEHECRLLAGELLDALAHALSSAALLAMGAEGSGNTDTLHATLASVSSLNREALADLRRLVRVLDAIPTEGPAEAPFGALAGRLPPTVAGEQARRALTAAGLRARVHVPADADSLGLTDRESVSRLIEACAERMLQHARPGVQCRIDVTVDGTGTEFVASHPPGVTAGPARELAGLRTRLRLLGGALADNADGPRWRVIAWLPLDY